LFRTKAKPKRMRASAAQMTHPMICRYYIRCVVSVIMCPRRHMPLLNCWINLQQSVHVIFWSRLSYHIFWLQKHHGKVVASNQVITSEETSAACQWTRQTMPSRFWITWQIAASRTEGTIKAADMRCCPQCSLSVWPIQSVIHCRQAFLV